MRPDIAILNDRLDKLQSIIEKSEIDWDDPDSPGKVGSLLREEAVESFGEIKRIQEEIRAKCCSDAEMDDLINISTRIALLNLLRREKLILMGFEYPARWDDAMYGDDRED